MNTIDPTALLALCDALSPALSGRSWTWTAGKNGGYPQHVISEGNVLLIAETYDEPDRAAATAAYIAALDPATVRALVAAYVEQQRTPAQGDRVTFAHRIERMVRVAARYRAERDALRDTLNAKQAWIDGARIDIDGLTAEVTALRAAVARMTGAEAVEAAAEAMVAATGGFVGPYRRTDAAAAVRAIAALGAP